MKTIEDAVSLRNKGKPNEALMILNDLLALDPMNPILNYQIAWTNDFMGNESEAIPFYEQSIEYGLNGDMLKGAYIGLGSTYRCLGEYKKSLEIFNRAILDFPHERVLKVFKSLTLYNLGQFSESVESLLIQLLDTCNDQGIKSYDRALRFYSDKLNQTWK